MNDPTAPHWLTQLVQFYEQLEPADLARLDTLYAPDAHFKDPFNEVQGVPAIRLIFEHMFRTLDAPRFVVSEQLAQGAQGFLVWTFVFRFRGEARERSVRGSTHVRVDAQGRVQWHRDYWDAAEELYEQLPLLGALMRWLRRRLRAH